MLETKDLHFLVETGNFLEYSNRRYKTYRKVLWRSLACWLLSCMSFMICFLYSASIGVLIICWLLIMYSSYVSLWVVFQCSCYFLKKQGLEYYEPSWYRKIYKID